MYKVEFFRFLPKSEFQWFLCATSEELAAAKKKALGSVEVSDKDVRDFASERRSDKQTAILLAVEELFDAGCAFAFLREADGWYFGRIIASNGKDMFGFVRASVQVV